MTMLWWQREGMLGDLQDILSHYNATTYPHPFRKTDLCKMLFDALNKAWTAFSYTESDYQRNDFSSLVSMIKAMDQASIRDLLTSKEVANLTQLEPPILDHSTLKKAGYRPNTSIHLDLQRLASSQHREFNQAHSEYDASDNIGQSELVRKLARLLYVVRSNIAHGEKTPYGPDIKKMERDESVSGTVIPVQRKLLHLLLDNPDEKLVVYGTLAPGEPNAELLEDLDGIWNDCLIKGRIEVSAGLKYLDWIPDGSEVRAKILFSSSLTQKLPGLESFEGDEYRRIWIPALVDGIYHVANVFCRKGPY